MISEKYQKSIAVRQSVKLSQKAWKYIYDQNSHSLDSLNETAVSSASRDFSYGLMFREWERYASVFTALGMTEKESSRVGVLGSNSFESICSFYGLNMVGAEVSLIAAYMAFNPERVFKAILAEHLTDFIVTDDFSPPEFIAELIVKKEDLGLRNIIILHVPVIGPSVNPVVAFAKEVGYAHLRSWFEPLYMDTLLGVYGDHPVRYASNISSDSAFILHTSGTTGGTGKPIVLSDQAFNAAIQSFLKLKGLENLMEHPVTSMAVDLSNAYGIIDQVHLILALGGTIAVVPGGVLNTDFYKSIPAFGLTCLFATGAVFERWLKMPESTHFDFRTLRCVILGGTFVSAGDKKRYIEFLKKHGGSDITFFIGYGISEIGGACCFSSGDPNDESIGYPMPGVNVRLYDEEHDLFLSASDAPCEGILYLNSDFMASSLLDGQTVTVTKNIDDKEYVCTNDLAHLDQDRKLTFLGRANRYFINQKGVRYESGRVETEISRQTGIESCGMIPVYIKKLHDNIPMLCVKTTGTDADAPKTVAKALKQVFVLDKTLTPESLPHRVKIVSEMPRNGNGKIDMTRISRDGIAGKTYMLEPIRIRDQITDIRLKELTEDEPDMIGQVYEEIRKDLVSHVPGKGTPLTTRTGEPHSGGINEMMRNMLKMTNHICQVHQRNMTDMYRKNTMRKS